MRLKKNKGQKFAKFVFTKEESLVSFSNSLNNIIWLGIHLEIYLKPTDIIWSFSLLSLDIFFFGYFKI